MTIRSHPSSPVRQVTSLYSHGERDANDSLELDTKFALAEDILASPEQFHEVSGTLKIVSYVIYSIVTIDLRYVLTGERMHYDAKLWGIGLDTSESIASGLTVMPERLAGECICLMKLGANADGAAQLTFWRDDQGAIGHLDVTATGDASADFGGSGFWDWA